MATCMQEIEQHLAAEDLAFRRHESGALVLVWSTDHYRNNNGDNSLLTVIGLREEGELVSIFAPAAYSVTNAQTAPALVTCAMISARVPLVCFEFIEKQGIIVPSIDLSIEDGTLTAEQLGRCLNTLVGAVDTYHDVVRLAIDEGTVDPALVDDPAQCRPRDDLRDLLDLLPPEVILEAAERARARQL